MSEKVFQIITATFKLKKTDKIASKIPVVINAFQT